MSLSFVRRTTNIVYWWMAGWQVFLFNAGNLMSCSISLSIAVNAIISSLSLQQLHNEMKGSAFVIASTLFTSFKNPFYSIPCCVPFWNALCSVLAHFMSKISLVIFCSMFKFQYFKIIHISSKFSAICSVICSALFSHFYSAVFHSPIRY